MGAAEGPVVSCCNIKRPHLKIAGLPAGGEIRVLSNLGVELTLRENGLHHLSDSVLDWIKVSCSVSQRHMTVCEVVSRAA